jgi:hypothetical protein
MRRDQNACAPRGATAARRSVSTVALRGGTRPTFITQLKLQVNAKAHFCRPRAEVCLEPG